LKEQIVSNIYKRQYKHRFLAFILGLGGIGIILAATVVGATMLRPQPGGAHAAEVRDGQQPMSMNQREMHSSILPTHPMFDQAITINAQNASTMMQINTLACLTNTQKPLCYSPQRIRQAYAIQPLLNQGITGKTNAITIIDAFQDPKIRSELHMFDQIFGMNDPQLNIIAPFGLTPFNPADPDQVGFAGEIALDVEWAHAIAPGATINLALANVTNETIQGELNAMAQITRFVVQNNIGSVISQSFGISESCAGLDFIQQEHRIFQQARAQHQTVFASAGDMGAATVQCDANGNTQTIARGTNVPSSDPLVSSVGGTSLQLSPAGDYLSEQTWNDSQQGRGATGGGVSSVFPLPAFQQNSVQSNRRVVNDISFDADPLTGVPVVTSEIMPGKTVMLPVGGTSVGSPVAAGLTSLFDQVAGKRLGFLNSAFYRISRSASYAQAFHDVRQGNNTFVFQDTNNNIVTIPGFKTGQNWDVPTGVGTPIAANLANLLPQFQTASDGATL
jgi:subtilase family serine protease